MITWVAYSVMLLLDTLDWYWRLSLSLIDSYDGIIIQENCIASYEEKASYMKRRGWLFIYYYYNFWIILGNITYLVTYWCLKYLVTWWCWLMLCSPILLYDDILGSHICFWCMKRYVVVLQVIYMYLMYMDWGSKLTLMRSRGGVDNRSLWSNLMMLLQFGNATYLFTGCWY